MALIGTISGSVGAGGALTSATAITGTLVVANTSTDFPVLASDAIFFVSGATGAIASSLPGVAVFGGDLRVSGSSYFTDIDVTGHSAVVVQPYGTAAGQTGEVRFKELAANGGNYTALKAADSIAANLSITLPNADGSNGNVLQTNGSGVTSFVDVNSLVTGSLSLVTINASSNITASNILANGDLAVNGGDITTTFAGTFNLLSALTSSQILSTGGSAGTINIGGTSTGTTTTNIQTGTNTAPNTIKTINIGTQTTGTGQVYVNIGSTSARLGNARITLHNEVHLTSGTLVGSPGGINNELTLVSSGSAVIRLDTNNDGPGHRFEIRDFNNATEFAVSETGNAEIAGTLLLTGSSLSTLTTTTFNFLNTALTGTLNVSELASTINFGGSITTSSFSGEVIAGAKTLISSVTEKLTHTSSAGSTVNFDLRNNNIFYVTNPITANITANFINTQTTSGRVITPTIILSQSATARIVNGIQVNSASGSILWANNVIPTGNANKQDVFGFSLIRSGTVWIALGQMSTYG